MHLAADFRDRQRAPATYLFRRGEVTMPLLEASEIPFVIVVPVSLAIAVLSLVAYVVKKRH